MKQQRKGHSKNLALRIDTMLRVSAEVAGAIDGLSARAVPVMSLSNVRARNAKNLAEIRVEYRPRFLAFEKECFEAGIPILIYEADRICKEQDALFAQGRTVKGKKVTNARAGQSFHQYRCAIDYVPLKQNMAGYMIDWNAKQDYLKAQAIAAKHGLRALSWELPHLEINDFKGWRDLRAKFGNPC